MTITTTDTTDVMEPPSWVARANGWSSPATARKGAQVRKRRQQDHQSEREYQREQYGKRDITNGVTAFPFPSKLAVAPSMVSIGRTWITHSL